MDNVVCTGCHSYLTADINQCPGCGSTVILSGADKNVIDQIEPNCLIHRYEGSDLLEPARMIKEARTNVKVALKLKDYSKPVIVPKSKVYSFNHDILSSIQALRNERVATMHRFDQLIQSHWQNLKHYNEQ